MKVLAERIRQLRLEIDNGGRPLSPEKLAQRLDVSQGTVKKWEKDINDPGIENLMALSEFFDVDIYYLLGRTDERGSSKRVDHKP